jgi:hypothetical protein
MCRIDVMGGWLSTAYNVALHKAATHTAEEPLSILRGGHVTAESSIHEGCRSVPHRKTCSWAEFRGEQRQLHSANKVQRASESATEMDAAFASPYWLTSALSTHK